MIPSSILVPQHVIGTRRAADTPPGSSAGSTASNSSGQSNQLDANSFITLLTAQLQAQNPLNPLDPNQMVNELTSMNTLQQTLQIRQDLDAMVKAIQAGTATPVSGLQNTAAPSVLAGLANPNTMTHNAALTAARFRLPQTNFKL